MKKYSILFFSLVLGLTSCNNSDDDATPESAHVYTNRVEITSYQDEKSKEIEFNHFFESTLDFKYNKLNQLYEINNAITYRNVWSYDPETETFPNNIINTTTTRSFKYDASNERILEEKTVQEGKTTINFFTYNDAKQLIAIRNEEKETVFNYTAAGQVESITTTYTKASENNSVQKLAFDNKNNLVSLEYIDASSSTTYYFKYSDLTSVYVGNPINYTLRHETLDRNIQLGYFGSIKRMHKNFLDQIEFVYKGFHLLSEIESNYPYGNYTFELHPLQSPFKYLKMGSGGFDHFYYKSSMIVK